MGLGAVTLGQSKIGNFQAPVFVAPSGNAGAASTASFTTGARISVDSGSGSAAVTTSGVVREVSPAGDASANGAGTLGVTRSLTIDPETRVVEAGLGATTLGSASVGGFQETTAEAGAETSVTGGILRDASVDVVAGSQADPTLGVIRDIPIASLAGSAPTTTLGVIQRVSVASDAGAAPTIKLFRGVLDDHLFVALGDADVVSVAVGLRRRGNNPDT